MVWEFTFDAMLHRKYLIFCIFYKTQSYNEFKELYNKRVLFLYLWLKRLSVIVYI